VKRGRSLGKPSEPDMPQNLIEWVIFIGAGIALGAVLFLGLSA
jgi:hypothetical protein